VGAADITGEKRSRLVSLYERPGQGQGIHAVVLPRADIAETGAVPTVHRAENVTASNAGS
jgi:hypothetical protein